MDLSKMTPYKAPIAVSSFPHLTVTLCGFGLFLLGLFMINQISATKFSRNIVREVALATTASFFLGFGTLFLLLWVGIYV
ncbi:unnamed protein product [Caenorhabditis bovis]|uniref:Dolichyl-diphosphooligosaccharide-protein glycosyltransferase subunit TMEM258 n=1 Tax=Caenorhabditis bovis TaxID=2654633 RepID=A0A8S1EE61_9PELO|nr:unnamed protein product [Caenorhabditis bovis]